MEGVCEVVADCEDGYKEPEIEVSSDETFPRTPMVAAKRLSLRPQCMSTSAPMSVSELMDDWLGLE